MPRTLTKDQIGFISENGDKVSSERIFQAHHIDANVCSITVSDEGVLEVYQSEPYTVITARPGEWEEIKA